MLIRTTQSGFSRRAAVLWCLALLACGCSRLDFSREIVHNPFTDVMDSGAPYMGTTEAEAEMRTEQLAKVLSEWKAGMPSREDFRIGPGDVIKIVVFALEKPGANSEFVRTIPQDGLIALPWIEKMKIAGLTVSEVEHAVKKAYGGRYLKNPQVTVSISAYKSVPVVVTGAVARPGVYYLTDNKSTVLEVLVEAGGLTRASGAEALLIRAEEEKKARAIPLRDGVASAKQGAGLDEEGGVLASGAIPINLGKLVDEGDLRLNLEIGAGDILTVRSGRRDFVYVLGYVRGPGAFELRGGQRLDALRAIARAGGLASLGRADHSFLLREGEDGRQTVTPVDVIKMARGVRPLLYLEPGDTLIVGTSFMGRLSEIVRPAVGVGANATYSATP